MTVMEALQKSRTPTLFMKGTIKTAQQSLMPNEDIIWAMATTIFRNSISGALSTDTEFLSKDVLVGLIMVTNQRIFFVKNNFGQIFTKELPINAIRSMDATANQFFEVLRIVGHANMIVMYDKKQNMQTFRNAIQEAIRRQKAASAAAPVKDGQQLQQSDIEQLQTLKQLCDAGVITPEEFAAKKAQILKL